MLRHPKNRSYCVVVSKTNENPDLWGWTINRRSPPIGVKIEERGFPSYKAAMSAGQVALVEFLDNLSLEELNKA